MFQCWRGYVKGLTWLCCIGRKWIQILVPWTLVTIGMGQYVLWNTWSRLVMVKLPSLSRCHNHMLISSVNSDFILFIRMTGADVPESLKCGLCSQACKRGVKVGCYFYTLVFSSLNELLRRYHVVTLRHAVGVLPSMLPGPRFVGTMIVV